MADLTGHVTVVFDAAQEQWVAIYSRTKEVVVLPATTGEWLLLEAEGSVVAVEVIDNGCERKMVDIVDLLRFPVFSRATDGKLLVRQHGMGSARNKWLSKFLASHKVCKMSLWVGATSTRESWPIYMSDATRDGCNNFLSMAHILLLVGIVRKGKSVEAYMCRQFASWRRALAAYRVQGLLGSKKYDKADDKAIDPTDRILREKTCSTIVLICLLAGWGC